MICSSRNHRRIRAWCAALSCLLVGCADHDPLSGLAQGETGRVVRIIDGDALVLDTGLTVRLIGIEAPAPERRNRPGQPYAETSSRTLEDLAMGRTVRLIYPGITRDRYDRALAYVKTDDRLGPAVWLNREMLRRGAARARFYPDTSGLGDLLIQDEAEARENNRGLWAMADYRPRPAWELAADAQGFYMITATLGEPRAPSAEDEDLRCLRALQGTTLELAITLAADELCLAGLTDSTYEVRGYIYKGQMEITHRLNAQKLALTNDELGGAKRVEIAQ